MDINAMRQKRASLVADARSILDGAQEAGRDLEPDEESRFDQLMGEADRLDGNISRAERMREVELRGDPDPDEPPHGDPGGEVTPERAFRSYLLNGRGGLSPDEARALQMGSDPDGGYLVAPQQFVGQLIQEVDDMVHIRQLATVMQLTEGESLGAPSRDDDVSDAEWTAELQTGGEDDSLKFGKRELRPHPLAKRVKVSRTLLRRSSMDPESIVRARLAYKFGVSAEKAYLTGDGNQKPLGLFVASSQGISTSRDVDIATDGTNLVNAAGGNAADGLIDAKYTLKPQYHRRARWLFHRFAIRDIRKLKDDQGQYIWQPGLSGDRPDTILEIPYILSEFVPNTFSDNAYFGMLADFSFYWIADALDLEVQRLVELYAETNQVGFIGRLESDGMPVLEEAFVRLQADDVVA